jgi:hypothetical protein
LTLRQATVEAQALAVPLEIALFVSDAAEKELQGLLELLFEIQPPVCTWLIFHTAERSAHAKWIRLARQYLLSYSSSAKIGSGTSFYFAELNRGRPPTETLDVVCYSLNPQVHAFDNASLVEALATQAVTLQAARRLADGRLVAISPITLRPRCNPNATNPDPAPEALTAAGRLPPQVDVRQMSLFGAAWTVGSLKYVCEGGAYSATYYETTGWCGVMETERGSPLPRVFRSLPGAVYSLYHVLADVGECAGGTVLPTTSSDPLRADGLALSSDRRTRVIVANFCSEVQCIEIRNLNPCVRVRYLDETNAEEAMRRPEAYRAQRGEMRATLNGALRLKLLPYAVARLDSATSDPSA